MYEELLNGTSVNVLLKERLKKLNNLKMGEWK